MSQVATVKKHTSKLPGCFVKSNVIELSSYDKGVWQWCTAIYTYKPVNLYVPCMCWYTHIGLHIADNMTEYLTPVWSEFHVTQGHSDKRISRPYMVSMIELLARHSTNTGPYVSVW